MYEITKDTEIYKDDIGNEFIVTDDPKFYLDSLSYDSVYISNENIKTKDDMIRLNDEIKRTNYSIKNIIKQILMKDKTKETELKKLLNDEIDNDFVLIGLINELRK